MSNNDNVFLFLGKTGVGKSLCIKLLSSNSNIKVSHSKKSCTKKIDGYNASIPSSLFVNGLNYKLVDTPGLNDSDGEDSTIVKNIKSYLTNKSLKIKGIFIFLNFQDVRFDNAEQNIIRQIYKLIPLDHFWNYITIVFTHFYGDRRMSADKKKRENENSLQKVFEDLIIESYKKELIIPIRAKDLRIEYIDLYDPDIDSDPELTKKENEPFLDKLKNIFKTLSKKDPLYSEITESVQTQKVVEKIGNNQAILYNCQVKAYKYYNQQGKVIKEKYIILSKEKIKVIERSDYGTSIKAYIASIGAGVAAVGCYIGAAAFPLAAPGLIFCGNTLVVGEYGAAAVCGIKYLIDRDINNTYDKSKNLSDFDEQW